MSIHINDVQQNFLILWQENYADNLP